MGNGQLGKGWVGPDWWYLIGMCRIQVEELCCNCTDGAAFIMLFEWLGIIVGLVMVGLHMRHFNLVCGGMGKVGRLRERRGLCMGVG